MASKETSLLINCDDLGYHSTLNEGIVDILSQGWIRSASILASGPHFDDAVERLCGVGIDAVGIHLSLSAEYPRHRLLPVSEPAAIPSLVDAEGRFFPEIAAIRDRIVPEHVELEFRNQVERVRARGLRVTHVDGHMFCYEAEEGGSVIEEVAESVAGAYRLPMRFRSKPRPRSIPNTYMIWDEADVIEERHRLYLEFFRSYEDPLAELIIHPGKDLSRMKEFSRTGSRRLADYLFFSGEDFHRIVRTCGIRLVTWDEV